MFTIGMLDAMFLVGALMGAHRVAAADVSGDPNTTLRFAFRSKGEFWLVAGVNVYAWLVGALVNFVRGVPLPDYILPFLVGSVSYAAIVTTGCLTLELRAWSEREEKMWDCSDVAPPE